MKKEKIFKIFGYLIVFLTISIVISFFRGGGKPNLEILGKLSENSILQNDNSLKQVKVWYFWATWCGVCKLNQPFIKSNYSFFKDKIYFLSIEEGESKENLEAYIQKNNIDFPVFQGSPEILKSFEIKGFPTTLFLDKNNQIVFSDSGILNPVSFYLRIIWIQLSSFFR
ncbi:MAG: TlpA family protein disulfide reductase [Leptospiraceae bacterium]|nr:TlpA family protein disulfide reductase [Leptospiraceae bacterium]MCK6381259.1 TlpA family protein disulfide reductase [Leptospiraceae bacterium]NUM42684.1 TlpA family protein disulfide reductase [Leptospiraceae bacterium]